MKWSKDGKLFTITISDYV